jgi:CRISPR-associated protein Csy1
MSAKDDAVRRGRDHMQRGEFAQAIACYEDLLAADRGQADVWHLKGMAEHQAGKLDAALASARQAIASGGDRAPYLLLEGAVLHDRGDLAPAELLLLRAVEADPAWVPARMELGDVRMDMGRATEAVGDFRAATEADPRHVRAWNNLGASLQVLERIDEAMEAFGRALQLDPSYGRARFSLARLLNLRGDTKGALQNAQEATRSDPRLVEAWLLVGDIERRNRNMAQALAAYSSAVRAAPTSIRTRTARADLLAEMGRIDEARGEFRAIAGRHPESLRAALRDNLLLPQVYRDLGAIEAARSGYAQGLERLHENAPRFRFARAEAALADARWTNFYLAYQGHDDRALQARYGEFQKKVLKAAAPQFFAPRERRAGRDRLRVGFLSFFFFNSTAGRYFMSWITHLDKSRFESVVYYTNEWMAEDSHRIAAAADTFRHLPGRPLHVLAQQVIADDLDILVYPELGMNAEVYTLAGLRLAPVQCCGWGHPNTTGHEEIDWFISSEAMEPEGAQASYTERLALLPGLGTRYAYPSAETGSVRADFGLPDDRTIYLVPQSLFKIHPESDDLIAQVLARDPRGLALMFSSHHDALTDAFVARIERAFARRGLDLRERARLLEPFVPHESYLRLNQLCDVMLDTPHWSGGNTSLDAFANGLPVVTLPGSLMRGRQSAGMLRLLGVPELIVSNAEEYVATAVRLGTRREEREAVSQRIKAGLGNLFERDEPVRAFESFLERAARAQ